MSQIQQRTSLSSRDVLYEAARVACLAPSIEDSQPWLWRIHGDTLELRVDRSRQLTGADPLGRLMVISCGAVLHHATVVLAVLGAAATVERVVDPTDPDLLARLTLTGPHQVTADEMRLHHALRTRCTDRRPFLGIAPLPEEVMTLLREATGPFAVEMRVAGPAQMGVVPVPAVEPAATAGHDEVATWTIHRAPASRDAVPTAAAVPRVSRTGPMRDLATGTSPDPAHGPGEDRFTTYLAFTTEHDTRADWLHTGEAVSAVLLTATTVGLASSVVSDAGDTGRPRAPHGATATYPQLTIRLGVNESAPAVLTTPRRPRDEVIEVVPPGPSD